MLKDFFLVSALEAMFSGVELSGQIGRGPYEEHLCALFLTLNAPIATKVVCFSRLLKCLRSLYRSLFWVHAVCFYT